MANHAPKELQLCTSSHVRNTKQHNTVVVGVKATTKKWHGVCCATVRLNLLVIFESLFVNFPSAVFTDIDTLGSVLGLIESQLVFPNIRIMSLMRLFLYHQHSASSHQVAHKDPVSHRRGCSKIAFSPKRQKLKPHADTEHLRFRVPGISCKQKFYPSLILTVFYWDVDEAICAPGLLVSPSGG